MRAAQELDFTDPLLWVNDPAAAALLARTGWRTLYDVTDDWLHAGLTGAEHARLVADESLLLRDAAHVVVCSPALLAAKRPARQDRALSLVPNAVDVDAYRNPGPRPADLPQGPVVLYVGTVHADRVDLALCASTARRLGTRATVVLVGPAPIDPAERRRLEEAGVVLLGPRDSAVVPAYLTHADVLLVPHVVTPFTDSLDPIKLYEYRAANRPVVSTPVAGFREADDPRVTLAVAEDFPVAVVRRPGAGITLRVFREKCHTSNPFVGRFGRLRCGPCWTTLPREGRPARTPPSPSRTTTSPSAAAPNASSSRCTGPSRTRRSTRRSTSRTTRIPSSGTPGSSRPPSTTLPVLRRHHRTALPLLPLAARSMRISEDVVLASSSGWAHGFSASGRRLVYCHAPARWLYQAEAYLGAEHTQSVRGLVLLSLTPWLKRWDKRHALAADGYLANSRVVRDRMREAYGIEAPVLPAPHAMDPSAPQEPVAALDGWSDYHLVVSRLLPYKNVEAAVEAFRDLPERLVVVGHGPLKRSIERRLPANVRLIADLTDAQLRWVYAHSRALVAPSLEDYGLTPLEAAAYGKPTLALGAGGYLDTVVPGTTGLFFSHPTPREIRAAVLAARTREWSETALRDHAEHFGEPAFHAALHRAVGDLVADGQSTQPAARRTPRRLVRALGA